MGENIYHTTVDCSPAGHHPAIGQPVEVVISDRLVARGDLVKLSDDRLGVSLTEIVKDYVSEK